MALRHLVLILAVLMTGLSSGFFYTYDMPVLPGLKLLDDTEYVSVFQSLNRAIRNEGFGLIYFGTLLVVVMGVVAHLKTKGPVRWLVLLGFISYLSLMSVTAIFNVQLNRNLESISIVTLADAAKARLEFEEPWNYYNRLRAVAACSAFIIFTLALAMSVPANGSRKYVNR